MSRHKNIYKIIVLGDSDVGKTSILNRCINDNFSMIYRATIGADFFTKDILLQDGNHINLQIWDTAGNEKFHSLGSAFYRGTNGCVLVFDITNSKSFYNLQNWYDEFLLTSNPSNVKDFPFVLLGNKIDLISNDSNSNNFVELNEKQIKNFCENKNIKYYSVSAKTDKTFLENIFEIFAKDIYLMNTDLMLTNDYDNIYDNVILQKTKEQNKCCVIF